MAIYFFNGLINFRITSSKVFHIFVGFESLKLFRIHALFKVTHNSLQIAETLVFYRCWKHWDTTCNPSILAVFMAYIHRGVGIYRKTLHTNA